MTRGPVTSVNAKKLRQMRDKPSPPTRFLVRQGSKGWMVYDRQRKAPAMIGTRPLVNLTKEQAAEIERKLTAESERKHST